jgi:hypothetical protein
MSDENEINSMKKELESLRQQFKSLSHLAREKIDTMTSVEFVL